MRCSDCFGRTESRDMNYVMIVDDDLDILQLVRTGLEKTGLEVEVAESARTALSKIGQRPPDLLITDAMMPEKDGYQLARELRGRRETAFMPIIMLTALQGEHDALRAFQDGVDDFISKPFSMAILRARVNALFSRTNGYSGAASVPAAIEREKTGVPALDAALGGGIPGGSNILVVGETGRGKSRLGRRFIANGLAAGQKCMFITVDDNPVMVRKSLEGLLPRPLAFYEDRSFFRLVDSYSWSRGITGGGERIALSGALELNQLAGVISDGGAELGQTVTSRTGGRRVLDSVTSLFVNFDLAPAQRFLTQLARTATSYGGVSTLFILEEGSLGEQMVNNLKYLMDGVIELKYDNGYFARVASMKWSDFSRDWVPVTE